MRLQYAQISFCSLSYQWSQRFKVSAGQSLTARAEAPSRIPLHFSADGVLALPPLNRARLGGDGPQLQDSDAAWPVHGAPHVRQTPLHMRPIRVTGCRKKKEIYM